MRKQCINVTGPNALDGTLLNASRTLYVQDRVPVVSRHLMMGNLVAL